MLRGVLWVKAYFSSLKLPVKKKDLSQDCTQLQQNTCRSNDCSCGSRPLSPLYAEASTSIFNASLTHPKPASVHMRQNSSPAL